MSFSMNDSEFNETIAAYSRATGKDMAESMNRALRNLGYKAAQFTPKKDPATIEAELRKDQIGLKFITGKLTRKKGTTYTTRKGKLRTIKRVTRKQIALRTRQFIARRKKRTGFLRAGWVAALVDAGVQLGSGLGGNIIKSSKGALGTGRKATPEDLFAFLGNGVWGRLNGKGKARIASIMVNALNRAIIAVTADMKQYMEDRMNKTASKYSAKASGSAGAPKPQSISNALKGVR